MRITEFITEAANPAQQAAIAIAKKEEQGVAEAAGSREKFTDLKSWAAAAKQQGLRVGPANGDSNYSYWAVGKGGEVFGKFVTTRVPQNNHGYIKRQGVAEDWNKVNHHDKTSGMSQKAVNAYRRENPGSKLKTAVTTKPSKLKPGSKAANRRKSFCARMGGNKGPMKKPNGKPTPKALALRRWNCESIEQMEELVMIAEQKIRDLKK